MWIQKVNCPRPKKVLEKVNFVLNLHIIWGVVGGGGGGGGGGGVLPPPFPITCISTSGHQFEKILGLHFTDKKRRTYL